MQPHRPSTRTWVLAAVELTAALAVARLIAWDERAHVSSSGHHDHSAVREAHWGWVEYTAIGVAAAAFLWWLVRRQAVAAVVAAAALAVLVAASPVRVLATRSHVIAMVALELLTVAVPLLLLAAFRSRPGGRASAPRRWRGPWTASAVVAALLYSGMVIVIHVPVAHHRATQLGYAPLWVAPIALTIGIWYWFSVLRTAERVPNKMRRAVLIGAQEIAAFVGLLSLFGAWGAMNHTQPLGISAAWDQRLGGAFMIATCAAVAIPISRTLRDDAPSQRSEDAN